MGREGRKSRVEKRGVVGNAMQDECTIWSISSAWRSCVFALVGIGNDFMNCAKLP